jgi:hypothetical protein
MILRLAAVGATLALGAMTFPAGAEEQTDLGTLRQLVAMVDFDTMAPASGPYQLLWELRLLEIEKQVRDRADGIDPTVTGTIPQSE